MNTFQELYEQNIVKNNVEFEIRLGKQTSKQFKSCINKDNFDLLMKNINNQNWKTKSESTDTDIFLHGGYRKTNNIVIKKINVCKYNKKINKLYDLKLSLNIESPIDVIKKNLSTELIRRKKRFSFYKDFYRFDLTIVNDDIYEVEMELVDITYARKHSFDFIINNMIDIFQYLISSSNFKWST